MTRILYWNINNFSRNKILNDSNDDTAYDQSQDRLNHIVQQVFQANLPDIFVIVEVYSRTMEVNIEGTALRSDSSAGFGVLLLLDEIRARAGNNWCLVPPLNTGGYGFQESVAVFYNSTNLQFAGPYIWAEPPNDVTYSRAATQGNIANLKNYPTDWRDGLPVALNRTSQVTAGGVVYNIPESQFAAQVAFCAGGAACVYDSQNRIFFPNNYNRSPYHVQFYDLTGGANNRLIKLFAIHTSPASATAAVQSLANSTEIQAIGNNQVSVVIGDFNVDSFANRGAYTTGLPNHTMQLEPNALGAAVAARKPYCMTHLLPTAQAVPYNNTLGTDPQHNVYPRFGYMGSMGGQNFQQVSDAGAIDNAFTRYGPLTAAPGASNMTVVNTVVGTPYNATPLPANVPAAMAGHYAYGATLANAIPQPGGVNGPPDPINFQGWNNFGKIHSVSDHLALILDV
ncbi:MAG: hypothetical protein K0R39_1664 [Symbiobacteriaceae bacterium]|nr:hypothetical protein [Symbiobacteriaceae bacterium]